MQVRVLPATLPEMIFKINFKENNVTKVIDGIEFTDKEVLAAEELDSSFSEAGKIYKRVYGFDNKECNQIEIQRLLSEGWEIASENEAFILLGCNNVVNVSYDEEGVLCFEYGSNL